MHRINSLEARRIELVVGGMTDISHSDLFSKLKGKALLKCNKNNPLPLHVLLKKKQKKTERAGVKDSLGSQLTPTHGMPAEFVPNRSSE